MITREAAGVLATPQDQIVGFDNDREFLRPGHRRNLQLSFTTYPGLLSGRDQLGSKWERAAVVKNATRQKAGSSGCGKRKICCSTDSIVVSWAVTDCPPRRLGIAGMSEPTNRDGRAARWEANEIELRRLTNALAWTARCSRPAPTSCWTSRIESIRIRLHFRSRFTALIGRTMRFLVGGVGL